MCRWDGAKTQVRNMLLLYLIWDALWAISSMEEEPEYFEDEQRLQFKMMHRYQEEGY